MAKERSRWDSCKTLRTNSRPCSFCKECDDVEVLFGVFYTIGKTNCHHYCLLLSSHLTQNGQDNEGIEGFLHQDISNELRRVKSKMCYHCGRNNATLMCCVPECGKSFHLPCGRRNGALNLFHDQFQSYCALHRPVQHVPTSILTTRPLVTPGSVLIRLPRLSNLPELEQLTIGEASKEVIVHEPRESSLAAPQISSEWHTCGICYDKVTPLPTWNTLWPPCCKGDKWFHRICVAMLALSAGRHYVKCPLCNNQPIFLATLLKFGFYVPDRDASWEREEGAFMELHERPKLCCIPTCLSSVGRHYSGTKLWQLVICSLCGSQAAHRRCANIKVNRSLVCSRCKPDEPAPRRERENTFDSDAFEELSCSEDAFNAWRDDANSARERRDSPISVAGSSSGTCNAYLTMNNDLIIKTEKENVYSVRSIDSAIIKSLSPKKGELVTNDCTKNVILRKLLTSSVLNLDGPDFSGSCDRESSADQPTTEVHQSSTFITLNEAPEECVEKPPLHYLTQSESIYSSRLSADQSENKEESVRKPGPRRSIRRGSICAPRISVGQSDNMEESVNKPGPRRSIRRDPICLSNIIVDNREESVRKPGPRRSIRREPICLSNILVDQRDNREESVRKPGPRPLRDTICSARIWTDKSDNRKATTESAQKPTRRCPVRRESTRLSRIFADKSSERLTTDDLDKGKRFLNDNIAEKALFASYFKNPVKAVQFDKFPAKTDAKTKNCSTNKYNGGKFKVKISPTSSKHKHEKIAEEAGVPSSKETFKGKVEKYFQHLEQLRSKTTLNAHSLDPEQPLRIVFKMEGFLSKSAGPASRKRKRQSDTQSQSKKVKSDKFDSKPCPKSKKLFYIENAEVMGLDDKMDVEEEASIKYKIINDDYAKVITSRRVFTVPIPKCPGNKSKRREKRKSAETGQTNIMSYFHAIDVKKEATINTQEKTNKNCSKDLNPVDEGFGDGKNETPFKKPVKIINNNFDSPAKQSDVVLDGRNCHESVLNDCVELPAMPNERKLRRRLINPATALNDYGIKKVRKIVVPNVRDSINGRYVKVNAESKPVRARKKRSARARKKNCNRNSGKGVPYKEVVGKGSSNTTGSLTTAIESNSEFEPLCFGKSEKDYDMETKGDILNGNCLLENEKRDLETNIEIASEKGDLEPEISEKGSLNRGKEKLNDEQGDLLNDIGKEKKQIEQGDLANDSKGKKLKSEQGDLLSDGERKKLKNEQGDLVNDCVKKNKTVVQDDLGNEIGKLKLKSEQANLVSDSGKEKSQSEQGNLVSDSGKEKSQSEQGNLVSDSGKEKSQSEQGNLVSDSVKEKSQSEQGDLVNGSGKKLKKSPKGDLAQVRVNSENISSGALNVTCDLPCQLAKQVAECSSVGETDLDGKVKLITLVEASSPLQNVDVDAFINGCGIFGETWQTVAQTNDDDLIKDAVMRHIGELNRLSEDPGLRTIDEMKDLPKDMPDLYNIINQSEDPEKHNIHEIKNHSKSAEMRNIDEIKHLSKGSEIHDIDEMNDLTKGTEIHDVDDINFLCKDTEIHIIDAINYVSKDTEIHYIDNINLSKDGITHNTDVINNTFSTRVLRKNDDIYDLSKGAENTDEINPLCVGSLQKSDEINDLSKDTPDIQNSDEINNVVSLLDDAEVQENSEIVSLLYDSDTPDETSELSDANKQKNDEIVVSLVDEDNDESNQCILTLEDDDDEIVDLIQTTKKETVLNLVDSIDLCDKGAFQGNVPVKSEKDFSPVSKKYADLKMGTYSSFSVHDNVLNVRRHAKRVIKFEYETPYTGDLIEMDDPPRKTNTQRGNEIKDSLLNKKYCVDSAAVQKEPVKRDNLNTCKDLTQDSDSDVIIMQEESFGAGKKCEPYGQDCVIVTKRKRRKRKRPTFKNSVSLIGESDVTRNKNQHPTNSEFVVNSRITNFFSMVQPDGLTANQSSSFNRNQFSRDFWREGSDYLKTVTSNIRRKQTDSRNFKLAKKNGR